MNINDYRRGMDRIAPAPELKERIMMNQNTKKRIPARRVINGLLAAALALACLFTAALAASPELRTAVLSFFRMEEHEQVPGGDRSGGQSGPDISQADIGELVKAQYIRMDSFRYGYSGGLLNYLTWSEDWKTLQDAKFWEVQDSEMVPVQVDMHASKVDITYKDVRYQGEFYWFVREGELYCFAGDNRSYNEELDIEYDWNLTTLPGRTDSLLLRLSRGRQMDYTEYPLLYHLDTGEAEDILAGAGVDKLEYAYGYEWSDNFRRAIILTGNRQGEEGAWLCDLEAGTLSNLNDLATIDEGDVCTAAFADNDTLVLYAMTRRIEDGVFNTVTFYTYDLRSGSAEKILDKTPFYRIQDKKPSGVMTTSGSRCLLVSEEGQVRAVDLKTGAQTFFDSFTLRTGDRLMFNLSGTKLLYFSMDSDAPGLGITQIGVADLEKGVFFAFDRDGYENLEEGGIGWQDDNTVGINARTLDDETHYLLLYQF